MSVTEIKKTPEEPKETIRQLITRISEEGGEHYDMQGDVVIITLDKNKDGLSVYCTLQTLELLGLMRLAEDYALGE